MARLLILGFGVATYGIFFLTFLYLVAFVGNLQLTTLADAWPQLAALVPYSIDAGRDVGHPASAVAINLGLILLFGVQHSIMARTGFKTWLSRRAHVSLERGIYVLVSTLLLILLMWQWRPLPGIVWSADSNLGTLVGYGVFAAGFLLALTSTFLIDHFELFGLKQVWGRFSGREPKPSPFVTPLPYRFVRHPLYLGFFLAFWGTPVMTHGHLLFAGGMTLYVLIGVRLEERDLVRAHGEHYARYREQVPMLIPVPGRSFRAPNASPGPARRRP